MRVIDPANRCDPQLAYGIHYPSLTRGITFWDRSFGTASAAMPVIVTEWDANSTTGCVPNAPATSQVLLDYLASKHIGVVGFAFDLPGTIVADSTFTPTSYAGFACGVPGAGPGQILFGDFAAEAQAGDGTQPDPRPAWIVSAGLLGRLQLAAHATAAHFFNTPRTFVTGASASALALLGMGSAVPTTSFADEARLAAAVTQGRLAARDRGDRLRRRRHRARPRWPSSATRPTTTRWRRRSPTRTACCSSPLPRRAWSRTLAPATPAGARDLEFLRLGLAARHRP